MAKYLKHPLIYIGLLLIISGLYLIFTKRKVKVGTSYGLLAPKEAILLNAAGTLTGNFPKDTKAFDMSNWEKKVFGWFFLIAGLALAIIQYYLLK